MDAETSLPGVPLAADLVTADPVTAQRFYGSLLDWTFRDVDGVVECVADGAVAASLVPRHQASAPVPGWRTCFLGSSSRDTAHRVRAGGGRVLGIAPEGGMVHAADPAGASFAVAGAPTRSPAPRPGPGLPVWYENMTTDAGVADSFYERVLGITAAPPPGGPLDGSQGSGHASEAGYALLLASGRVVAGRLVMPSDLAAVLAPGWMVYFAESDVDETAVRAVRLGGSVVVPPRDAPTGRVAALTDPEGATFTVIHQT